MPEAYPYSKSPCSWPSWSFVERDAGRKSGAADVSVRAKNAGDSPVCAMQYRVSTQQPWMWPSYHKRRTRRCILTSAQHSLRIPPSLCEWLTEERLRTSGHERPIFTNEAFNRQSAGNRSSPLAFLRRVRLLTPRQARGVILPHNRKHEDAHMCFANRRQSTNQTDGAFHPSYRFGRVVPNVVVGKVNSR